ncbi:MAG: dockerin type I domain-containing protein [Bacteroidota bacterium]
MENRTRFRAILGVLLLTGQLVHAQSTCLPPTNLQVIAITETTVQLQWTSANTPPNEHCWNLEIGGAGFACGSGTAVIASTYCSDDPALNINDQVVTVTVEGLQPGTAYDWSLVETCDGIIPPFNTSGLCTAATGPTFATFDDPFAGTLTIVELSDCPSNSPGFLPAGRFTVDISDGTTCPNSTYDLILLDGPYAIIPSEFIGVTAGSYPFLNAGPGSYRFTLTEMGGCNPQEEIQTIIVEVPEVEDTTVPIWELFNVLGTVVADNDPSSTAPLAADLGELVLPEGSCSYQQQWYAVGEDECDGLITAAGAIESQVNTVPNTGAAPTAVVITSDNMGTYLLDINWGVGQSTIDFIGMDINGNAATLQLSANVPDQINPSLSLIGLEDLVLPFCESSRTILVQLLIQDACASLLNQGNLLGNLAVQFNGSEIQTSVVEQESGVRIDFEVTITDSDDGAMWTASYEDPFGNIGTLSQQLSVVRVQEDTPPLIIAADENFSLATCQSARLFTYSATIQDDCSVIDPDQIMFEDGGSGLLQSDVVLSADGRIATLQLEGAVSAGTYQLGIAYQDQERNPTIEVVQNSPLPATIQLPAQTSFTLSTCESSQPFDFAISIADDCDTPIESANAIFTLGNQTLQPTSIEQQAAITYFYFSVAINTVNDGDLLRASYLDGDELLTVEQRSIQVTSIPDQWPPIITYPSQALQIELDPCTPPVGGLTFFAQATDNCDGATPIEIDAPGLTISAIGNDEYLATATPGTYTVTLRAADAAGNVREEDFELQISQAIAPEFSFSCNDTINVVVDEACQALLTLDQVGEGSLGCWSADDFDLLVLDETPANGAVADGTGTFPFSFSWNEPAPLDRFDGVLGPEGWELTISGDGGIEFGEELVLSLDGEQGVASAWTILPYDGELSFTWSLTGEPAQGVGVLLAPNGTTSWNVQSSIDGNISITVAAGTLWLLAMEGPESGELSIANLSYTPTFEQAPASCEGVVRLEDKAAPVMQCPDAITVLTDNIDLYTSTQGLNSTGVPVVVDNCGSFDLEFEDQVAIFGDCGGVQITRTFTATDASDNSSTCVQIITIDFPQIMDISLPADTVVVSCGIDYPTLTNGNPSPELTGIPSITVIDGTFALSPDYANLSAIFSDGPPIEVCESSFVFLREWTISDWCNPGSTELFNQIIKVGDFEAPILTCPFEEIPVFTTGPFDCTAAFMVPEPLVVDSCSSWSVRTEIVGEVEGVEVIFATLLDGATSRMVAGIPEGEHQIRYTAIDDCGNEAALNCPIQVLDATNPLAICTEGLQITLGGQGIATISSEDINNGSEDNCAIAELAIRRSFDDAQQACHATDSTYSMWGNLIELNCCDAGQVVSIELWLTDEAGNQSTCWTQVAVEDKSRPRCTPPNDVSIDCTALPYDFEPTDTTQLQQLFGTPIIVDNCTAIGQELAPVANLNDCGDGTILRSFRGVDQFGNLSTETCQQTVTIQLVSKYKVKFPKDATAQCGEFMADTISLQELGCDLLAVSVANDTFSLSGLDCFKVLRTYRVIDWCTYNGASEPVLVERDEDCDDLNGEEDVWLQVEPNGTVYYDRDSDFSNAIPSAFSKDTSCDGMTNPDGYWRSSVSDPSISSVGFWQYTQEVKVQDTIAPTSLFVLADPICALADENCDAIIEELFFVNENCTPQDLRFRVFVDTYADGIMDADWSDNEGVVIGVYPKYKVSGILPQGDHLIEIQIIDGCGNVGILNMPLEVIDCKAPTPFCINGLSTGLSVLAPGTDADGDGDEDLAANTLFVGSFLVSTPLDDCTNPVTYSINRSGELPNIEQNNLVLTCDDPEHVLVQIYAWDSSFNPYAVQPDGSIGGPNFDFCETYVQIDNVNGPACGINLSIAGAIHTEMDQPVGGVKVQLNLPAGEQVFTDSETGSFRFETLESGVDYSVIPYLDENADQGVSTFDLVLITKHILGDTPLDSPYKLIAADVDNSGSITVSDLIQLRELILNVQTSFSNNTSWRFVPSDYLFPNPVDPWEAPFPELIGFNNLQGEQLSADFVAIKIGDVTLDALSLEAPIAVEVRTSEKKRLLVHDQWLEAGQYYAIPLYCEQQLEGVQFALTATEGLELSDLQALDPARVTGRSHKLEESILSSWNFSSSYHPDKSTPTWRLEVLAQQSGYLSNMLSLDEKKLISEWIVKEERGEIIYLHFTATSIKEPTPFFAPNVFSVATNLYLNVMQQQEVSLSFYDISGKEILQKNLFMQAGTQQLPIHFPASTASGMIYYQIKVGLNITNGYLFKQ